MTPQGEFPQVMPPEDRIVLSLRQLYEGFGFRHFKMSTFEEYGLYLQNKNFLASESLITFNDTRGRVLALKPDVTLSIVKNSHASPRQSEKYYYIEQVYRVSPRSGEYQEIPQVGLELMGGLPDYTTLEAVALAVRTMERVSPAYLLEVSHMGLVKSLLEEAGCPEEERPRLVGCLRQKNLHGLRREGEALGLSPEACQSLCRLGEIRGEFAGALEQCRTLCRWEGARQGVTELESLYRGLRAAGLEKKVRLDFAIVNDLDYYNGVIFQGFVEGVPRAVLAGGRYDNLMKKFGRDAGAIGFALYLGELERLGRVSREVDVDRLVLCRPGQDAAALFAAVDALVQKGLSVRVEEVPPSGLRAGRICRFDGETIREVEDHA